MTPKGRLKNPVITALSGALVAAHMLLGADMPAPNRSQAPVAQMLPAGTILEFRTHDECLPVAYAFTTGLCDPETRRLTRPAAGPVAPGEVTPRRLLLRDPMYLVTPAWMALHTGVPTSLAPLPEPAMTMASELRADSSKMSAACLFETINNTLRSRGVAQTNIVQWHSDTGWAVVTPEMAGQMIALRINDLALSKPFPGCWLASSNAVQQFAIRGRKAAGN